MIYFCFIDGDRQTPVEMRTLRAPEDDGALQEAASLPLDGRQGHVFDGDRYVGSVAAAGTRGRSDARKAAYGLGGIYLLEDGPAEGDR